MIEAGDILSKTKIYLDDTPSITVPEIKAKLRRLRDVDLVIIDYLQLMSSANRKKRGKPCAGNFRDYPRFESNG